MSTTKKPCKNNPTFTYSGKESSPLGLGYTAESEHVGTTMEGRDKTMWMVGIKNGVKVWNRIPTHVTAVTQLVKEDTPEAAAKNEEVPTPTAPKKKAATAKKVKEEEPKKTTPKKKLEPEFTKAEDKPKEEPKAEEKPKEEPKAEDKPKAEEKPKEEPKVEEKPKKKVVKKKVVATTE